MPPAPQQLDVLHLSVLNATDHPRMTQRLAASQATAGYRVGVMGVARPGPAADLPPGVRLVGALPAPQGAWPRLRRARALVDRALALRPRLVVLHSPELLLHAAPLARRGAVWLDLHEDYPANLRHATAYAHWPRPLRALAAAGAAALLRHGARHLAAATYAEACYGNALRLPMGRWALAPNHYQPPAAVAPATLALPEGTPLLLSCGTLADDWGLWSALHLWRALNRTRAVHWAVVGQGSAATLARLHQAVQASGLAARCTVVARPEGVAYGELMGWVQRCSALLALYRPTAAIAGREPTKLFEAMAHGRPVLLTRGGPGAALNARLGFGLELEAPWQWADRPQALAATADQVAAALGQGFAGCYARPIEPAEWQWAAAAGPAVVALTARLIGPPEAR